MGQGKRDAFIDGLRKQCSACGVVKPLEEFSPQKNGKGGRTAKCRECKRLIDREHSKRTGKLKGQKEKICYDGASKVCTLCNLRHPLDEFYLNSRGRGGRSAHCKKCQKLLRLERGHSKGFGSAAAKRRAIAAPTPNSKICTSCGIRKGFDEFYRRKSGIAGRSATCKMCDNSRLRAKGHLEYDPSKAREKAETAAGRASRLLRSIRHRCSKVKPPIPCDLDRDWLKRKIQNGTCEATGIEFVLDGDGSDMLRHPFSPSVDRVDPDEGYLKNNCRLVISNYNTGKANWDDETLHKIALAVLANDTFGA